MNLPKVIYSPNALWQIEIDGEKSPTHPYEDPIFFRGVVAFSPFWSEDGKPKIHVIARTIPDVDVQEVDSTLE